jgi:tetratricopeptide (TPR) repeat protein
LILPLAALLLTLQQDGDFNPEKFDKTSRSELPALIRQAEDFVAKHPDTPGYPRILSLMSRAWSRLGRHDEEMKLLERLVAEHKDDARTWAALAVAYAWNEKDDRVRPAIDRAMALKPALAELFLTHGWVPLEWPSYKPIGAAYESRALFATAIEYYQSEIAAWEDYRKTPQAQKIVACGNVRDPVEDLRLSISRCRFGLGQTDQALKESWDVLVKSMFGREQAVAVFVDLSLRAGKLSEVRPLAEKHSDLQSYFAVAERFEAKDPAGILNAVIVEGGQHCYAGQLLGRLGAPSVEALGPLILKGDDRAITVAGFTGLRGLIKPLADRRYSVAERNEDRRRALDAALQQIRDAQP